MTSEALAAARAGLVGLQTHVSDVHRVELIER
jgi:hypothetical protein